MKSLILGLAAAAGLAAALPAAAMGVDASEHHQAQRIEQGVHSGALTPQEAYRLHQRETQLHRYEYQVRSRHHGYLTPEARRRMARMEAHNSHVIYRLKHNGRGYYSHGHYYTYRR